MAPVSSEDLEERGTKRHPDVSVGVALLAFCGIAFWNTTTFREVSPMLSQNVPPTFFPRLILGVIATLSAVLLVSGSKQKGEARDRLPAAVWVTAATMAAIVALIPRLGMLATVFLAAIVLSLSWGERRAWRIALLAVGLPLSVYLIFVRALGMRFPDALLL